MAAFIIWLVIATFFVGLGIFCYVSKSAKAFGFWANAEVFAVKEGKLREYNKALGRLWIVFGIIFALLGIPLLKGQNAPEALISVVGTMFLSIGTMVYYTVVLENKYRKK